MDSRAALQSPLMTKNLANEPPRKSSRVKREIRPESELGPGIEIEMVFNERKLPVRLWTEEEYSALLDGLNKFQWGEWKEISTIVKTRTSQQVSNRLLKFSSELPSKNKSQLQIDLHKIAVLKV